MNKPIEIPGRRDAIELRLAWFQSLTAEGIKAHIAYLQSLLKAST